MIPGGLGLGDQNRVFGALRRWPKRPRLGRLVDEGLMKDRAY
jgi:hypothetical protein